jgi:UDP-N-acetylglucosamine 2-epimerase (non-hydrolysing)
LSHKEKRLEKKSSMQNRQIKIMAVIGTRPEAVKMAPVIQELKRRENIETLLCLTAQHRQMLDQVLELFDLKADIDLNLMKNQQTLPEITASILFHNGSSPESGKPDWILVQGDTTTVMQQRLPLSTIM